MRENAHTNKCTNLTTLDAFMLEHLPETTVPLSPHSTTFKWVDGETCLTESVSSQILIPIEEAMPCCVLAFSIVFELKALNALRAVVRKGEQTKTMDFCISFLLILKDLMKLLVTANLC